MNPEAGCRAARQCLGGSESRNRLSGGTHVAGFPFAGSDRCGRGGKGGWERTRWLEIGLNTVRYSLRRERVRLAAVGAVTRLMRGQQPAGGWLYFLQE